jgi:hypothetical protein
MTLCQNPAHRTLPKLDEKCSKYGKNFMSLPQPIFTKLTRAVQLCKRISYVELRDTLTSSVVADTRSQRDKQTDNSSPQKFLLLTKSTKNGINQGYTNFLDLRVTSKFWALEHEASYEYNENQLILL